MKGRRTALSIRGKRSVGGWIAPKSCWVSKLQKLSVSAAVAKRGPFQPTNGAIWKMEGARRRRILVVVGRCVRWLRLAVCNGDFAIAMVHMDADRDGDARSTSWCDVSGHHHRSNGRGVVCPRWQNALQHRQCSAVHSGVNPLHPVQRNFVDPTLERPRTCATAKWRPRSVPTRPKWGKEMEGIVTTWRTRRWTRLEAAKALESRLKGLEASDSDFNWILLLIYSFFIMYIVYS